MLTMNPTRISELKTENFKGVYKIINPCSKITLTDYLQMTINKYKLATNKHQQNNNICDILVQKHISEK